MYKYGYIYKTKSEKLQKDMYLIVVECYFKKLLQVMLYVAHGHTHILKLLGYKLENVYQINDRGCFWRERKKMELGGEHEGI